MKKAFITGITGQDGSYLAELLLSKGYEVHALKRRSSTDTLTRIKEIVNKVQLHEGDLTDSSGILRLFQKYQFDEVYNLAAQSHVRSSFEIPEYTADVDALGVLRILEAIRTFSPATRFYQASTSELFGKVQETPQSETTPFYPRSPYGVAKLYAYWIVKNYREAYNLFASNGILFNHESPRRGDEFVTQKIIKGVAAIYKNKQSLIELGNLDSKRDWGHAKDYVEGMWEILQTSTPDDYVLATGELHSVREFVELAFNYINMPLTWEGVGLNEVGKDSNGVVRIKVNSQYYRPTEVELLLGDASKAKRMLGWHPKISFKELAEEMLQAEL